MILTLISMLLITGCSENSTEAPSTTLAEDKSLQNVANQNESNSTHDDKGKIEKAQSEETKPMEVQQAENLIRQYLELGDSTDTFVEYDHNQKGKFVIHVYDIIDKGKTTEHTATRGWYLVDPETENIEVLP